MTKTATPITIVTGFLGAGKTTLILNLLPQLPPNYKLCLLKNEFGDLAVDSQLAAAQSISGVTEMLNGCICCNLTGQLGDALADLRKTYSPDRILIETSGSAFPATLAMEVNRLSREQDGGGNYELDGVVSVIDVENWEGYEDTSVTAKLQAQFTDLVIFNKWEHVDERRFDVCLDRLGDLEVQTPWVKSDKGKVGQDLILGIDGALAKRLGESKDKHDHEHAHDHSHSDEVDVLSVTLQDPSGSHDACVDVAKLQELLSCAPKDEVYRIKGIIFAKSKPRASTDSSSDDVAPSTTPARYILNWAFGRWTFTHVEGDSDALEPVLRLTIISGRYESAKWKKRIETEQLVALAGPSQGQLTIDKIA